MNTYMKQFVLSRRIYQMMIKTIFTGSEVPKAIIWGFFGGGTLVKSRMDKESQRMQR